MPTAPHEILQVAHSIRGLGDSEPLLRSCVSRAYYAALLETSSTIPDRDGEFAPTGESSHEKVISKVDVYRRGANPGRGDAAIIYKHLPAMKRARVKADYRIDQQLTPEECDEVFQRAEAVLNSCAMVAKVRPA